MLQMTTVSTLPNSSLSPWCFLVIQHALGGVQRSQSETMCPGCSKIVHDLTKGALKMIQPLDRWWVHKPPFCEVLPFVVFVLQEPRGHALHLQK